VKLGGWNAMKVALYGEALRRGGDPPAVVSKMETPEPNPGTGPEQTWDDEESGEP